MTAVNTGHKFAVSLFTSLAVNQWCTHGMRTQGRKGAGPPAEQAYCSSCQRSKTCLGGAVVGIYTAGMILCCQPSGRAHELGNSLGSNAHVELVACGWSLPVTCPEGDVDPAVFCQIPPQLFNSAQPCFDWYHQVLQSTFLSYHYIYIYIYILHP